MRQQLGVMLSKRHSIPRKTASFTSIM